MKRGGTKGKTIMKMRSPNDALRVCGPMGAGMMKKEFFTISRAGFHVRSAKQVAWWHGKK